MSNQEPAQMIRAASKNEKRHIIRHELGFYHALTLTGLYALHDTDRSFDAEAIDYFIPALKHCIATHPILSAAIQGENTEEYAFIRPAQLNLQNHLRVINAAPSAESSLPKDDLQWITRINKNIHDEAFVKVDQQPPWKVYIVPLGHDKTTPETQRFYVIFAYSHSHGDGKSGLIFHRTFLEGLKIGHTLYDQSYTYQPPVSAIPSTLEESCDLKITWPYLILNLLAGSMPTSVWRWFGFRPPLISNAWTGKPICYDPSSFSTGSEVLLIDKALVDSALKVCRKNGAKFTGLLNQLIVHALDGILPKDKTAQSFVGQIVVDLKPLIPRYKVDDMANCASALHETSGRSYPTTTLKQDPAFWNAVRQTTIDLASCASTLTNQPIGLLCYVPGLRSWMAQKLGGDRESSYEISNLVTFDPRSPDRSVDIDASKREKWDIVRMIFSQPANALGSALDFQVVSMKGGEMVITLNWQLGVLGVPHEDVFAREVLDRIHTSLTEICRPGT
ncbi:alcohol acetyltransferase [Penicillium angulare]|uniref:Alcohol acetyltransferase n=1 Tax=Penicillium angulare TaxID=116970 RepID=A0A9W9EG10_9EURO|nr:alcohol acetyltransferase [Penicillium angulare]